MREGFVRGSFLLRVQVQVCSVDLVEPPQQVLGGAIDIIPTRVIWKVIAKWRSRKLRFEQIDLVEEQDNTGSHEPPAIDYRIEEH